MVMYTEARKIHLIEEVLKVNNQKTLTELEGVLKKLNSVKEKKAFSAHNLLGLWSKKDAALIEKAIQQGCEQIHEDDWK